MSPAVFGVGVGMVGTLSAGCLESAPTSSTAQAATVSTYGSSGCSTAVVVGLSKQISDEVSCIAPTSLVAFEPSAQLTLSSNAVLPYLEKAAADDLVAASEVASIQLNSGFRTIAQQYLLYRWYQSGRCGISAAAPVGRSNHESGRAIDVANWSSRISTLRAHGWAHDVPGDEVHFDHTGSPDTRGLDTKAFQRLWNRNNPNDVISEDGAYGPQTEARLKASPATGFAIGPSCTPRAANADVVAVDGPDRVAPDTKLMYRVTLQNNGAVAWPQDTQIVTSNGAPSVVYDADTWSSPTAYGELGAEVAAGGQLVLELAVRSPLVTVETPVFQQLALQSGGAPFGMINLALTVTPDAAMTDTSTDSDDHFDEPQEITGGCATGGAAGWLGLAPVVALLRRRRR
ncbi:MAG: M15 family metallopeptidase [Proteobacteria bacterium]|nr:M15 family metallopeptidase [Pseudomonadota bacterium]